MSIVTRHVHKANESLTIVSARTKLILNDFHVIWDKSLSFFFPNVFYELYSLVSFFPYSRYDPS